MLVKMLLRERSAALAHRTSDGDDKRRLRVINLPDPSLSRPLPASAEADYRSPYASCTPPERRVRQNGQNIRSQMRQYVGVKVGRRFTIYFAQMGVDPALTDMIEANYGP